jgi:hypothetical protein
MGKKFTVSATRAEKLKLTSPIVIDNLASDLYTC